MNWYKGGIPEAITASRKQDTIFVVYVEGEDEKSKKLSGFIEEDTVSKTLGSKYFTAIKIQGNSLAYQQFSEIYKNAPIPSIFLIGKGGVTLEIVQDANSASHLFKTINGILISSGKVLATFMDEEKGSDDTAKSDDTATVSTSEVISSPSTERDLAESPEQSLTDLTAEDKVAHAKELIEKKREEKRVAAEELEKAKEIERRKMGQDVQKLKRWQQDQEMKNILEIREKEKQEEKQARQRVLDQIKQDKAERASRFSNNVAPTPQQEPSPTTSNPVRVPPNKARIQFKLPDGSSRTNEFSSTAMLSDVRNYIAEILNLALSGFALSTTFPRREFTAGDDCKTLIELELVPNAVILVLPLSHGTVSTSNNNFLVTLFWSFVTPLLNVLGYLKTFVFGSPRNPSSQSEGQGQKRTTDPPVDTSRVKRKPGETTIINRQGNIHRLTDKADSDDENNTWNGNSTQQM